MKEDGDKAAAIAKQYLDVDSFDSDSGFPFEEAVIRDELWKVTESSFIRYGDINSLKDAPYIRNAWIANSKKGEKGREIDVLADDISERFGINVTPQDIIDYINKFPSGHPRKLPKHVELSDKYKELTGKNLNRLMAKKILAAYGNATPQQQADPEVVDFTSAIVEQFTNENDNTEVDYIKLQEFLEEDAEVFSNFPFEIAEEDIDQFKNFVYERANDAKRYAREITDLFAESNEREGGVRGVESKPQLTAEARESNLSEANELGWDNVPQAMASIAKRTGTKYDKWDDVPQAVRESVSAQRFEDKAKSITVPDGKGSWRKAFNDSNDYAEMIQILEGMAESKTLTPVEFRDIYEAAKKAETQTNRVNYALANNEKTPNDVFNELIESEKFKNSSSDEAIQRLIDRRKEKQDEKETTKQGVLAGVRGDRNEGEGRKESAELRTEKEKVAPSNVVADFVLELEEKYGVELDLMGFPESKTLTLSRIVVPKGDRNKGIGAKVMEEIIKFSDGNNKTIVLTPSTEFGATSVKRLTDFYKKFGFVENKGVNKDFTIRDSMYRNPQAEEGKGRKESASVREGEAKEVDLSKLEAKTQVQVKAKSDLKAALAKLDSFNKLGIASDPMQNAKQDLEWWSAVLDATKAAMKLLAVNTDIGFEKFQGQVLNALKKNSKAFDALSENAQRDLYAAIVEPTKQYVFTNRIIKSLDKGAKDLMKSAATLSATEYEQRVKSLQDGFKQYIDENKTRLSKYANNRLLAKASAIRSPQSLQAAIQYAERLIENGEFRARVEKAVGLQGALKTRIKAGDFTNIAPTVRNLIGYDLSELPADGKLLDRYIDIVNDLVNNKTPKFESLGQLNELAYDMQRELTFEDQSDMEYDPEEKGDPAAKVFKKMENDLEKLEELNTGAIYTIGDVVAVQRLINSINGRIEYLSTIIEDNTSQLAQLDAASARVIDVQKGSKEVMERIMRDTNADANTLLTQAVKEQDFGKESNAVMETVKDMRYIPNAAFIQARYDAAVAMSKGFMPPRVQVNVVHKYNALRKIDGIYKVIEETRKMVEKADKLIESTKVGKLFNKAAQRVGFGMKPLLSYEQIEEITDAMSVIDVKLIEADLALSGKAFDLAGTFFVPNTELENAATVTDKIYKQIEKAAVGLSEKERIRVGFYMLQKNQDAIYGDKSINVGENQFSQEYIDKWGNKGKEKRAEQQKAYDSLSKGSDGKVNGNNLTPKEREFADAMLKISETTLMPMAKFTAEQIQGEAFIELPEYYPLFYFQTRDANPTQKINDLIMGGISNPRYKSTRIKERVGGVNGLVEVDPLIAFAKAAQDVVRARYLLDARLQSRAYISAFNAKAGHKAAITEAIVRTSDNKLRTELMRQDINKAEAALRTVVRGVGSVFLGGSIERPLAELTSALFQMTYQFSKNPKLVMKYLNRLATPEGQQSVRNLARFSGSGVIKSDNAINMEVASYGEPTMMQRIRTIGRGYDKAAKAAEELVRKSSSLPELIQGGFTLYPMYLAERFEEMTGKPLDLAKIEGTYEEALPYLKENAEAIKDASAQAEQQAKMEVRTTSRGELAENVPTLFGKFNRKGMVAMLTHFLNGYMRGQAERHRQKVSAFRYKNAVGEPSFSKANMKVKASAFADLAATDISIFAGMLSYNAARGVYVGVGAAMFYAIKYMLADDEEEEKTAIQGIDESIKEARDAASPNKMIAEGVSALAWFLTGRYGSEAKLALAGLLYTKVGDKNAVDVMAEALADEGATEQEIAKMRELVAASASEFTRKKEWRIMKDDAFTTIAYGMLPPLEYMDRQRREVSKDMEALGKVKIGNTTIGEDKDYTVEMSNDLEGVLFFRAMSKVATGLALAKGTSVPALGSVNRWVNEATGAKYRLDTDFMLPKDGKGGITVLHTMNNKEFEAFQSEVNKKLKATEGKLWTKEYSDLWMEARKEAQYDAWDKVEPMMQKRLRGQ